MIRPSGWPAAKCPVGAGMILFVILCQATQGQEAPARLTLEDAFRRALRQNPALTRMEHLAGAAAQRVREARAGMMPSLAIQATATNGPLGAPAMGLQGLAGDPIKKHYGSSLNLIQPIFDFGRTQHLVASRNSLLRAAEQDVATQDAMTLLAVNQAYVNVLRRSRLVEVARANVRQREATLEQAQALADAGLKADVDAQLARANLAEARVTLVAAENEVRMGFAALNNAMGDTSLTAYQLESPPQPPATAQMLDPLTRNALEQRPELKSAALQVDAANQSIRSARSELLPRFDGIASAGAITPSKLITNNMPYAVGVSVTFPLYTGGAVEGRIDEEKQKREAAIAARREVEEAIKLQVARAWLTLQTRQAQVASAREQAAAANSSVQQAAERYRLQLGSVVELITAESAATTAAAQLVNAEYDLTEAQAELDWATGSTYGRYVAVRPKR